MNLIKVDEYKIKEWPEKKSRVSPKKIQSNQIQYQIMHKVQPWTVSQVKLRTEAMSHFKVQQIL